MLPVVGTNFQTKSLYNFLLLKKLQIIILHCDFSKLGIIDFIHTHSLFKHAIFFNKIIF